MHAPCCHTHLPHTHVTHAHAHINTPAFRLGAHYDIEGVADAAVLVLAKCSAPLAPSMPRPRAAFGRDGKACDAMVTLFLLVNRCDHYDDDDDIDDDDDDDDDIVCVCVCPCVQLVQLV